jgi:hypothetical protein
MTVPIQQYTTFIASAKSRFLLILPIMRTLLQYGTKLCSFARMRPAILIFICCSVLACALNLQPAMLIDRIKNRGPVAISSSNPYIAANQYLEHQRETSITVAQFLKSRGAPAAIELQKPLFEILETYLYYPENGEYYIVTETQDDWSIDGPKRISAKKLRQIEEVVGPIPIR